MTIDAHPEEFLAGGKHLTSSALDELVASIVHWSFQICGDASASQNDHTSFNLSNVTANPLSDDQRSVKSANDAHSQSAINECDSLSVGVTNKLVLSDSKCVILSRQVRSYFYSLV
jgi:hypothetical protein